MNGRSVLTLKCVFNVYLLLSSVCLHVNKKMNPHHIPNISFLPAIPAPAEAHKLPNGWSRVVASLLAQHSVLLQKLATATLVDPTAYHQTLTAAAAATTTAAVPPPSRFFPRPANAQNRDADRRKWRNRRNRHRKKLRRLFYSARKDAQDGQSLQVQRTLQSIIR